MDCEISKNIVTASLTTFGIGGVADYIAWPQNASELIEAVTFAKEQQLPITFLGGGSNTLIADKGIRGLLIVTQKMNSVENESNVLVCGAGIEVRALVQYAMDNELSGLEFAGGLPGSLGGAVWMNARAYGGEFSEIVLWVEAVNELLEVEHFVTSQMDFAYKKSLFQSRPLWVTKVKLQLKKGKQEDIKSITDKNISDRNSKQQNIVKSAGCVFKNNYDCGIPSGKLIEQAGLKNARIGGAVIFEEHANFVVNENNAKASDVIELMKLAQAKVHKDFQILIYPEVQFLGEFDNLDGLVIHPKL